MYFPVPLPLLLLFASAICASPIHNEPPTQNGAAPTIMLNGKPFHDDPINDPPPAPVVPKTNKDDGIYERYNHLFAKNGKKIEGAENALQFRYVDGTIFVRIVTGNKPSATEPVEHMIKDLGADRISWGWDYVPQTDNIAFIIHMTEKGLKRVKECLDPHVNNAGLTGTTAPTRSRTF